MKLLAVFFVLFSLPNLAIGDCEPVYDRVEKATAEYTPSPKVVAGSTGAIVAAGVVFPPYAVFGLLTAIRSNEDRTASHANAQLMKRLIQNAKIGSGEILDNLYQSLKDRGYEGSLEKLASEIKLANEQNLFCGVTTSTKESELLNITQFNKLIYDVLEGKLLNNKDFQPAEPTLLIDVELHRTWLPILLIDSREHSGNLNIKFSFNKKYLEKLKAENKSTRPDSFKKCLGGRIGCTGYSLTEASLLTPLDNSDKNIICAAHCKARGGQDIDSLYSKYFIANNVDQMANALAGACNSDQEFVSRFLSSMESGKILELNHKVEDVSCNIFELKGHQVTINRKVKFGDLLSRESPQAEEGRSEALEVRPSSAY